MKTKLGPGSSAAVWLWTAVVLAGLSAADRASAQDEVGQVTLLAGAPRMVGESIRPLQAILTGQQLETGESDAAGVLVEDIVFHVGVNSDVSVMITSPSASSLTGRLRPPMSNRPVPLPARSPNQTVTLSASMADLFWWAKTRFFVSEPCATAS